MNNINIIHIYRGEKGLITGETDHIMSKLDAKLVLIYNNNEYPVSENKNRSQQTIS
ncbi:hypothetical protein HMPREF1544_00605 [Mucor circinelloides 1006PhL]|uniref:Uncharacterized protein n=1 Tax=Mucor circinelloides f. circinelloides (strain 1006PhL) TaxID=1220926 RepID=S2JVX1_MUCC1|nr:hypothetical protein HMPREF1544_00605 [Mucor circinelloides 1006PhL]